MIAALLHDVVEDTPVTLEDVRDKYGDEVAHLVDGLTKVTSEIMSRDDLKKETYRKFTKYRPPSVLKLLAKLKQKREEEKEKIKKLARYLKCSTKKVKTEYLPYLKFLKEK